MADAREIITDALGEIGQLAAGEAASAEDAAAALRTLNRMVGQWRAERLTIHTITRTTFTISSTQDYAVASGSAVNVARPVYVERVGYVDTATDPDTEYPLEMLTDAGWAGIAQKALTSTRPSHAYYNPTYPTGTLSLWPIPTASGLLGVIYAPAATGEFASLDAAVSLPPGYERALVKCLALELAPSYERQVSPLLVEQAREAKLVLKRANVRPRELRFGADALSCGSGGGYDIGLDE